MKYIQIIKFLLTHDLTHLKECWLIEVTNNKPISIYRLLQHFLKKSCDKKDYLFWWRLANEMYLNGNRRQQIIAQKMQKDLVMKFKIDIELGAYIGKNLTLAHPYSITITKNAIIGENCFILQNVTIGGSSEPIKIVIGNNVSIGANSVILGGEITIGNNVKIGAGAFINKDIPDNCTVYTQKTNTIIQNNN